MSRPLPLPNTVVHRWPTFRDDRSEEQPSTLRASSPRIEQGGSGDRRIWLSLRLSMFWSSVGFVVGLAGPPYGLPPTDPTPLGLSIFRCRGQLSGHRGGRLRLLRDCVPLLTDRGRLTPTTNPALGNSPFNPLPFARLGRQAALVSCFAALRVLTLIGGPG